MIDKQYRWLAMFLLFIPLGWLLGHVWYMAKPDYHMWPEVTRCRGCDKEIWEWQDHERRSSPTKLEGDTGSLSNGLVVVSATLSSLYHTDCPDGPQQVIGVSVR